MFKHYNIATVMIDSLILDNLKFLWNYNYLKSPLFQKTIHLSDCIEEIQNTDTIIAIL